MQWADSVILITGGSSGLGAAVARMALAAGAKVTVADLQAPPPGAFPNAAAFQHVVTDVTDEVSAQAAIDATLTHHGRLDVLVNAAGIAPGEKLLGKQGPHRLSTFERSLAVNLTGSFNMMRLAVPAMLASPARAASRGLIVFTASVAAFDGQVGQVAYAAAKGGLVAMTLPAARELAAHRIRVMTIAPGVFETPMLQGMPQAVQDSLGQSVPHPARLGRPEEYAELVRSLVDNDYLNGEVIRIDGGLRLAAR
jgi:NAD(P)-dependent dehydrogenase (short-subunit alcohol dehydrogenase family)